MQINILIKTYYEYKSYYQNKKSRYIREVMLELTPQFQPFPKQTSFIATYGGVKRM